MGHRARRRPPGVRGHGSRSPGVACQRPGTVSASAWRNFWSRLPTDSIWTTWLDSLRYDATKLTPPISTSETAHRAPTRERRYSRGHLALRGGRDRRPDARGGLVGLPEGDDPIARVGLDPFHLRPFEPPSEEPSDFCELPDGVAGPVPGQRPSRHLGQVEERRGDPVDLGAP